MNHLSNERGNGGIGVLGTLGVVFVALKLLGKIDWSWWYVTAPFWGGLAIGVAVLLVTALVLTIKELAK